VALYRRIHSSSICFTAGSTWGMSLASSRREVSAADKPRTGRRPRVVAAAGGSGLMMPKDRQPTPLKRLASSSATSRLPSLAQLCDAAAVVLSENVGPARGNH
jgi:hypothetical protein